MPLNCEDCGRCLAVTAAERGKRKSRCPKPASTVAHFGLVVDKDLEGTLGARDPIRDPVWLWFRGAAWSKMKPGRVFWLKKQIPSDCDFRKRNNVDDGTGLCREERIAAGPGCCELGVINERWLKVGLPSKLFCELGLRNLAANQNPLRTSLHLGTSNCCNTTFFLWMVILSVFGRSLKILFFIL